MKKSILSVVCGLTALTCFTGAVEVRELSLNGPSYTPNIIVHPMDNELEKTKHTLSYDFDKIVFNHEYAGAKHVIDRLPLSEQTKILAYWHEAMLNQKLAPAHAIPEGGLTLSQIVKMSKHDTRNVRNLEDSVVYLRKAYSKKFNEFYDLQLNDKNNQKFVGSVTNRSKFGIKAIEGNFRVVDVHTQRILLDEQIKKTVRVAPEGAKAITMHIASKLDGWDEMRSNLAYKFTATAVVLSNGERIVIDDLYQKYTEKHQKLAKDAK